MGTVEFPKISRYFKVPKKYQEDSHLKPFEIVVSGCMTWILFFLIRAGRLPKDLKGVDFWLVQGGQFFSQHRPSVILRDCSGEQARQAMRLLAACFLQRRIHQRILVLHHHVAGRVLRKGMICAVRPSLPFFSPINF